MTPPAPTGTARLRRRTDTSNSSWNELFDADPSRVRVPHRNDSRPQKRVALVPIIKRPGARVDVTLKVKRGGRAHRASVV